MEEWRSSDPEELRRLTGLSNLVHAAALFNQYDTNNDGHLSRGDFLQLVRSESKRQGEARSAESLSILRFLLKSFSPICPT